MAIENKSGQLADEGLKAPVSSNNRPERGTLEDLESRRAHLSKDEEMLRRSRRAQLMRDKNRIRARR